MSAPKAIKMALTTVLHCLTILLVNTAAPCGPAWALDPARAVSQSGHRVWRVGEAGLDSGPTSIAQTPDGQIWIGTSNGLYRFDGKQFDRWTPAQGASVDLGAIVNLHGARNGQLYVGSTRGLFRISGGAYFKYPNYMDSPGPFREDDAGTVWLGKVGHHSDASAFCAIGPARLSCHGTRDGVECWSDLGLAVGNGPDIWVGGYGGVCRWTPGRPTRRYSLGDLEAPVASLASYRNSLLAAVSSGSVATGLWALGGGGWTRFEMAGLDSRRLDIGQLLSDRRGALWIGTHDKGLYRLADGRIDHFDHLDGLANDFVSDVMEDREGAIWIVTPRSVEQLIDLPIVRFTSREGMSIDSASWLAPSADGGVLAIGGASIDRISANGRIAHVLDASLAGRGDIVFEDGTGRVWFGADGRQPTFIGRRAASSRVERDANLESIWDFAEDDNRDVWVTVQRHQDPLQGWLWRYHNGKLAEQVRSPKEADRYAVDLVASDLQGGLWLRVFRHGLYDYRSGTFRRVEGFDAVTGGRAAQILPVAPGEAWLATPKGAIWLRNGRVRALGTASGLPCEQLYGVALDRSGNLWLTTQCDLVKVPAAELDRWRRHQDYRVRVVAFGSSSGYVGDTTSRLVTSKDGRLWFTAGSEVYELDPTRIPVNKIIPAVQVQHIQADKRTLFGGGQVILPKLTRNLEIDYVALSYLQPDLLRFRYRLFGYDRDWDEVGNRRQAFYNDLPPGRYRFEVAACNKDGVCSAREASTILLLPPAWWQTWFLKVLCASILAAMIAFAVRWRLNAYAQSVRNRFDDRMLERSRVARDLHDTLMQTVLASRLLAEGGKMIDTVPEGRAAFEKLSDWLGCAADEGRAAVDYLRASAAGTSDLMQGFELAALENRVGVSIKTKIVATGKTRPLHPIVRGEIHRIGVEAIRNVCLHSKASQLTIILDYAQNMTLLVRDNGQGMSEDVRRAGKAGHFGLVGMRERAEHIGAKLTISKLAPGTEIRLTVPGSVAYAGRASPIEWIRRFLSHNAAFSFLRARRWRSERLGRR